MTELTLICSSCEVPAEPIQHGGSDNPGFIRCPRCWHQLGFQVAQRMAHDYLRSQGAGEAVVTPQDLLDDREEITESIVKPRFIYRRIGLSPGESYIVKFQRHKDQY